MVCRCCKPVDVRPQPLLSNQLKIVVPVDVRPQPPLLSKQLKIVVASLELLVPHVGRREIFLHQTCLVVPPRLDAINGVAQSNKKFSARHRFGSSALRDTLNLPGCISTVCCVSETASGSFDLADFVLATSRLVGGVGTDAK
jgi:hypothetical protein